MLIREPLISPLRPSISEDWWLALVSLSVPVSYHSRRIISPSFFILWLAPAVFKSSDWPLWPVILSALTACYLHGDGWLRRFRASLLTTAEDRAHTWDTSPTLSHLTFSRLLSSVLPLFFFLWTFSLRPSTFRLFCVEELLRGHTVDLCLFFCSDTSCEVCHLTGGCMCRCWTLVPLVLTDVLLKNIKSVFNSQRHSVFLLSYAWSPVCFLSLFPFCLLFCYNSQIQPLFYLDASPSLLLKMLSLPRLPFVPSSCAIMQVFRVF